MPIYVDPIFESTPVCGHTRWCHCSTEDHSPEGIEALHVFVASIGMKRAWFQSKPCHPHYDLTPSKRKLAVQAGAIEVTQREYSRLCGTNRPELRRLKPIVRSYWKHKNRDADTILFFRSGEAYVVMGGIDAKAVAKATAGYHSMRPIGYLGGNMEFPASDLERILAAVVASGGRAAVLEQVQPIPAEDDDDEPAAAANAQGQKTLFD